MADTLVTVYGSFGRADNGSVKGRIAFTPSAAAVEEKTPPTIVTMDPVRAILDDTGYFEVKVIASDDPEWRSGALIPYLIDFDVPGLKTRISTYINGPGPWDIADLQVLGQAPPVLLVPGNPVAELRAEVAALRAEVAQLRGRST